METPFEDGRFDAVFSNGALHEWDQPEKVFDEVHRVLKPGGRAVFVDPWQTSRLLATLRSWFPVACLESPGGGALVPEEIAEVARHFARVEVRHFELLARLERILRWAPLVRGLYRLDARLLAWFPLLRRWSRYVVLEFTRD